MPERMKWTERRFSFDIPPGWLPNTIERLRGVGARLRELTREIDDQAASARRNDKWSIKEHIGHLADLEELWMQRARDFAARKPVLTAADMSNAKTEESDYNRISVHETMQEFLGKRDEYIRMLVDLDAETQEFQSMHPRLQVPVRVVDMAFFAAEHDDHHLASIRESISQATAGVISE